MPATTMLEVQATSIPEGVVLKPCRREELAFLRAQKPVPRLLVSRREFERVTGGKAAEPVIYTAPVASSIPAVSVSAGEPAVATPNACLDCEASQAGPLPRAKARRQQAKAGRHNAIVKDPGDRRAVRAEVKRIIGLGLSQTEACRQVAGQMKQGRAGAHQLTMKFDTSAFEATMPLVRRLYLSDW